MFEQQRLHRGHSLKINIHYTDIPVLGVCVRRLELQAATLENKVRTSVTNDWKYLRVLRPCQVYDVLEYFLWKRQFSL